MADGPSVGSTRICRIAGLGPFPAGDDRRTADGVRRRGAAAGVRGGGGDATVRAPGGEPVVGPPGDRWMPGPGARHRDPGGPGPTARAAAGTAAARRGPPGAGGPAVSGGDRQTTPAPSQDSGSRPAESAGRECLECTACLPVHPLAVRRLVVEPIDPCRCEVGEPFRTAAQALAAAARPVPAGTGGAGRYHAGVRVVRRDRTLTARPGGGAAVGGGARATAGRPAADARQPDGWSCSRIIGAALTTSGPQPTSRERCSTSRPTSGAHPSATSASCGTPSYRTGPP